MHWPSFQKRADLLIESKTYFLRTRRTSTPEQQEDTCRKTSPPGAATLLQHQSSQTGLQYPSFKRHANLLRTSKIYSTSVDLSKQPRIARDTCKQRRPSDGTRIAAAPE